MNHPAMQQQSQTDQNTVADLWLKIDQLHLNFIKAEESTRKIDIRKRLEGKPESPNCSNGPSHIRTIHIVRAKTALLKMFSIDIVFSLHAQALSISIYALFRKTESFAVGWCLRWSGSRPDGRPTSQPSRQRRHSKPSRNTRLTFSTSHGGKNSKK